jgi:hypothetical protein
MKYLRAISQGNVSGLAARTGIYYSKAKYTL